MDVSIRAARPQDTELLATLNAEVQALHIAHKPQFFRPVQFAEIAAWFRTQLTEPSVRIWIAELNGTPAGYVLVIARERPATVHPTSSTMPAAS
jgi:hypothetical protein